MLTEQITFGDLESQATISNTEIETSPFFAAIVTAIECRRVVALRYKADQLPRLFAPYILRHAKNGNFIVAGMQIENPNEAGNDDVRRTFGVLDIATLEVTAEAFVPIDTFTPDDVANSYGIIASVLPWK